MAWEVFFSDGSTISSDEVSPFEIEQHDNVQVIIQDDNGNKWKALSGVDYYIWKDNKWWGATDIFALKHYFMSAGCKCVLFGTWIEDQDYDKVFNDARKKWGEKPGFARGERLP